MSNNHSGGEEPNARELEGPTSVDEALALARRHGSAAAREALTALRALLDAAALAAEDESSARRSLRAQMLRVFEEIGRSLSRATTGEERLVDALARALDGEIGRWEERAREDPDARPVLRVFLGLREILWDLGVRAPASGDGSTRRPAGRRGDGRGRVQRVPVDG